MPHLVALLPASDPITAAVTEREEPIPVIVAESESEAEKLTLELFRSCFWIRSTIGRLPRRRHASIPSSLPSGT